MMRDARAHAMRWPLLLVLSLVAASVGGAQGGPRTVVVTVLDAESRGPLAGAVVVAGDASAAADANGRVRFGVAAVDSVRLGVAFLGYVPADTTVALAAEGTTYVPLYLEAEVRDLGGVVVTDVSLNDRMLERRGFFDRRDSRTGVFVTRAELDARNASQLSDIFRGMTGVRIDRGRGLSRLVSTRRRDCPMTVFIDGTEAAYFAENVDALPLNDVAAVEVYRGPAEVPMEYAYTRFRDTCGAVLVWTQIESGG